MEFEVISRLGDKTIQAVLRKTECADLAMALKTAGEDPKRSIYRNMSERAAKKLQEDMAAIGTAEPERVERARQKILDIMKTLADKKEIILPGD